MSDQPFEVGLEVAERARARIRELEAALRDVLSLQGFEPNPEDWERWAAALGQAQEDSDG